MFYTLGETGSYQAVAALLGTSPERVAADPKGHAAAYGGVLHRLQPDIPLQALDGIELVDDPALEEVIIEAFYRESDLDDLPRYRDRTFFEIGPERRAGIRADVQRVEEAIGGFVGLDPPFWSSFGLFVRYILCPYSRFSRGGTDSAAIGALFISRPCSYSDRDLYEILVHEYTHTAMFVDELIDRHYGDEALMAQEEHFARAAITGLQRPLDKVLHSLVVSTEILLHRDAVLGHGGDPTIHPRTPVLRENVVATIDSLRGLERNEDLLGDRGQFLIDRCEGIVAGVAG